MTSLLDFTGLICLALFAWFVWPPLPLLVVAVGCLAASRKAIK